MKVVVDSGGLNYCLTRARILIMEAEAESVVKPHMTFQQKLKEAMQLLTIARIYES
jgi:hypothetical protein